MEAMIRFVDAYRDEHGVEPICRVLAIAPSTYHAHARRREDPETAPARVKRDAQLMTEIRRVFDDNFQVYGVRKIWRQMQREGFEVARCTVARLMQKMGLQGVIRGKRVRTTIADKTAICPLDRVNRQFRAPRPNMLWVSDFTYVATWSGFAYVAIVIDAYARRIVGWRVSRSAHAGFVLDRTGAGPARSQARREQRPCPPLRPRRAVRVDQVQRAARRGRPCALRRQRWRQLRQRARRDDQRALQSRGDPSARAVAVAGGRRVRDPRVGRLVQQPPPARAGRQHPAGGSRSQLLRRSGGTGTRRMTQTKRPPTIPGQFTRPGQ